MRELNATTLGFDKRTSFFVNEHLTRHSRLLLGATVSKKKDTGWKYAWPSAGEIYSIKKDGSEPIRIAILNNLNK